MLAGEHERLRELRLRALASDPSAFSASYADAVEHPLEEWIERAELSQAGLSQRTFVLVAESGEWLGMALVRLRDDDPRLAGLNAMWVAPEARGGGAVKLLCDACALWAVEHDCTDLVLGLFTPNVRARRAYEAVGFVFTEETTWTREDGAAFEVQRMRRPLP